MWKECKVYRKTNGENKSRTGQEEARKHLSHSTFVEVIREGSEIMGVADIN